MWVQKNITYTLPHVWYKISKNYTQLKIDDDKQERSDYRIFTDHFIIIIIIEFRRA